MSLHPMGGVVSVSVSIDERSKHLALSGALGEGDTRWLSVVCLILPFFFFFEK